MIATSPTRPLMRYHGGKWLLADWIIGHFPQHRAYVEPYGGAGSVLFQKPPARGEVYNDLDGEVVNVFQVLRDPAAAAELERLLRLTPFARAEFVQSYERSDDPVEQARRTITRSFMGFGSPSVSGHRTGFRANGYRSTTAPADDWANYPREIRAFAARLRGVVIECRPAVEIIRQQDDRETLFYCDPPYPIGTRNRGNGYNKKDYRHEMTDDDHRQLAEVLRQARGMVVLSGYPCDLYDRELYADWHRVERSSMADGARARTEVLWLSPAAVARGRQLRLMEVSA